MKTIKKGKDTTDSSNQMCRLGLSNDKTQKSLIDSVAKYYVSVYLKSLSGTQRKRRATQTLTCTDINNLSGSLNALTVDQLGNILVSDFKSCQTVLGLSSNSWSSEQLATLATTAKSAYSNNVATISDSNLISLNSILLGLSDTDIASLVFSNTNSIQTLGSLTGWSSSQVNLFQFFFFNNFFLF